MNQKFAPVSLGCQGESLAQPFCVVFVRTAPLPPRLLWTIFLQSFTLAPLNWDTCFAYNIKVISLVMPLYISQYSLSYLYCIYQTQAKY